MKKHIVLLIVGVLAVVGLGMGGAEAAQRIGSQHIKNNAVRTHHINDGAVTSRDIRNRGVRYHDLQGSLRNWIHGVAKKARKDKVGLTDVTFDGPYPGATQLTHGSNSTEKWAGDSGATLQMSWVTCAGGEVAVGGGFSRADEGVEAFRNLQVVTAAPALIVDGEVISITGAGLQDHIVNDDWSLVPNGWVVEGFNNGEAELIVRPYVVCATDAD